MHDRTPQEDLLAIEALVEFSYRERDVRPKRSAWVIAEELATIHGLEIEDAIRQCDRCGSGV
ncbi:hypothetical protein [Natronorubrum sp. FCH18a]|uniref:hypothetical protein n=1 Tax=Natronorubrum sp. FCH18a TaxID=3447018 RepID=UPI003F5104C8